MKKYQGGNPKRPARGGAKYDPNVHDPDQAIQGVLLNQCTLIIDEIDAMIFDGVVSKHLYTSKGSSANVIGLSATLPRSDPHIELMDTLGFTIHDCQSLYKDCQGFARIPTFAFLTTDNLKIVSSIRESLTKRPALIIVGDGELKKMIREGLEDIKFLQFDENTFRDVWEK